MGEDANNEIAFKVDVYAFGVMVWTVMTRGRALLENSRERMSGCKLVQAGIQKSTDDYKRGDMETTGLDLAYRCTQRAAKDRVNHKAIREHSLFMELELPQHVKEP